MLFTSLYARHTTDTNHLIYLSGVNDCFGNYNQWLKYRGFERPRLLHFLGSGKNQPTDGKTRFILYKCYSTLS